MRRRFFAVGEDGDVVKAVEKLQIANQPAAPERSEGGKSEMKFDVVNEAVGKPETWEAAVQLARKGGTVIFWRLPFMRQGFARHGVGSDPAGGFSPHAARSGERWN